MPLSQNDEEERSSLHSSVEEKKKKKMNGSGGGGASGGGSVVVDVDADIVVSSSSEDEVEDTFDVNQQQKTIRSHSKYNYNHSHNKSKSKSRKRGSSSGGEEGTDESKKTTLLTAAQLYGDRIGDVRTAREARMSDNTPVDYVLVFVCPKKQKNATMERRRKYFEAFLVDAGFKLERELAEDGVTVFVKLAIGIDALKEEAEKIGLRMPLIGTENTDANRSWWFNLRKWMRKKILNSPLCRWFTLPPELAAHETRLQDKGRYYFPYKRGQGIAFLNNDNEELLFSSAQRSNLIFSLLEKTPYEPDIRNHRLSTVSAATSAGNDNTSLTSTANDNASLMTTAANDKDKASLASGATNNGSAPTEQRDKIGISRLLRRGVYTAAFPLHEGPANTSSNAVPVRSRLRHLLYEGWGRFGALLRPQPLFTIREYFGEKIGFYFAWLGFYTTWLWLPSIIGIFVIVIGLSGYNDRPDAIELCQSNMTMCALCESCPKWQLADSCEAYKVAYIFDNEGTIAFAILMSLWATLILEFWKRRNATLAYNWHTYRIYVEVEPTRPEFVSVGMRPHKITSDPEKYFPSSRRKTRYLSSLALTLTMIAIVVIVTLSIILYRLAVRFSLAAHGYQQDAATIASFTAAVINLIAILILNEVWTWLAVSLTRYENHRTNSNFEYYLTMKIFAFQFCNTFASLFYLAFFKGRFTGYPGNYQTLFGYRNDECPVYGCFLELTIQLAIILIGKQTINNVFEVLLPRLKIFFSSVCVKSEPSQLLPWEDEYAHHSSFPVFGLYSDYLEMVVQFGLITLFVSAFPLAPLFALLNNIFEIRVDADKFLVNLRRSPAFSSDGIGIWHSILNSVSIFSVVTNGLVISFSSDFVTKIVYRNRYGSLDGFVNLTHPLSPIVNGTPGADDGIMDCHYPALRDNTGEKLGFYYEDMMARLAAFVAFEHLVFIIKLLTMWLVPDIPDDIHLQMERESYQAHMALGIARMDASSLPPATQDELRRTTTELNNSATANSTLRQRTTQPTATATQYLPPVPQTPTATATATQANATVYLPTQVTASLPTHPTTTTTLLSSIESQV